MEREHDDAAVRGGVAAAAAILGIPVTVHDGSEWSVRDGAARVGLGWVTGGAGTETRDNSNTDDAVARVLLLLWESVREVRVAPARRRRRLALAGAKPELEPLLATLDRLLAAGELLAALPSLRLPIARVLATPAMLPNPAELPRHLQWAVLLLVTAAARWAGGGSGSAPFLDSLAPEVQRELQSIDGPSGETAEALLLALAPDPGRSAIERFERAYGLLAPGYIRLLELDVRGRGPQDGRGSEGAEPDPGVESGADAFDPSAGSGGADDDNATGSDSADGGDATSDGETERARAGDKQEGAEGADLFAAEQAGFVETVLATPLPAAGAWAEGLELPDIALPDAGRPERWEDPDRGSDPGTPGGGPGAAALASYRDRVALNARSIDDVREVWRQVVSERVHLERGFTRTPEPEGEMLDRASLVRVVADVTAGIERPRAFLRRERRPKRTRREGSTDYVLLIDRSASMQGPAASAAATAALIILEALAGVERDIAAEERALGIDLELSLRTALIVFDSAPHTVKPLAGALDDRARIELDTAIHSPQGSTNDAAALRAAADEFGIAGSASSAGSAGSRAGSAGSAGASSAGRPAGPGAGVERRRVAILVSDGGTNDADAAARELAALRAKGVTVFGIGIRTDDIASRFAPDGIRVDAAEQLPLLLEQLVTGAGLAR